MESGEGAERTSASANPSDFRALLISCALNFLLSLTPNRSSRVLKSIWIVPCSTHGRVASARRTRVGQPTAQDMPGTRKATSAWAQFGFFFESSPGGWGVVLGPDGCALNRPRTEWKKSRIEPRSLRTRWDQFSFQSLLSDLLEHHLGRDLRRVVSDVEEVAFQIDVQRCDAGKP